MPSPCSSRQAPAAVHSIETETESLKLTPQILMLIGHANRANRAKHAAVSSMSIPHPGQAAPCLESKRHLPSQTLVLQLVRHTALHPNTCPAAGIPTTSPKISCQKAETNARAGCHAALGSLFYTCAFCSCNTALAGVSRIALSQARSAEEYFSASAATLPSLCHQKQGCQTGIKRNQDKVALNSWQNGRQGGFSPAGVQTLRACRPQKALPHSHPLQSR